MKHAILVITFSALCASASYAQQSPHDSNNTIITLRSGERDTGRVLFAWDSVLVMWQSKEPYSASALPTNGKALHVEDVMHITVVHEGHFWSGMAMGAMLGFVGGAILGGAIAGASDSGSFGQTMGLIFGLGVIVAVPGALYFGIEGAFDGIDENYTIDGSAQKYHDILPKLWRCAIFATRPPMELEEFIRVKYGGEVEYDVGDHDIKLGFS